jgi:hypothetical protein
MTDGITLTGFLDSEIISEDAGTRARFRVCVSPSDDQVDELALSCSVADPEIARVVLSDLEPGDRIRVTGYLGLPRISGHPLWLHVTTLDLLDTAPPRSADATADATADVTEDTGAGGDDPVEPATASLSDHGQLERFGPYLVYTDPDLCADSVWTEVGEWVGAAVYPTTATELIHTHQRRNATGDA